MSEHALPAAEFWRLVALDRQLTIAKLEAKWAIAKAETDFTSFETTLREKYALPPGTQYRLSETT